MASISKDANGNRTIQFTGTDRKRRSVRLGKVPQKLAETIKFRIEQLDAAKRLGHPPDASTAEWVNSLDDVTAAKLAAVGLIPERESKRLQSMGAFLREYVASRVDVKPATLEVWSQTTRNLREHFGEHRELSSITEGDADGFKMYLIGLGLASTTVHKRLQFARQFFRAAKRRKLCQENPFAEVRSTAVVNPDRQFYLTREATESVLDACSPAWRVIVALSRYGGLRCPSEVLSLRWSDIDWERGRMTVTAPKTERHEGHATRAVPIVPELRVELDAAFERAPERATYVVGEYRKAALTGKGWRNANLRTQFERVISRAGLKPWPRLFHTMRASCETDWVRVHPLHVVAKWMGHSPKIALTHYTQVTDADFDAAIRGGANSGASVVQNAVQQASAENRKPSKESSQAQAMPRLKQPFAMTREGVRKAKAERTGFEPVVPGIPGTPV